MLISFKRLVVAALLAVLAASPAVAQVVTNHAVAIGRAPAIGLAAAPAGASGTVFLGKGATTDPAFVTMSGDCSLTSTGVTTCNPSYTAPYTGSVAETQNAYNAQRVSVKDFGATGNGSTDDTTAISAALASTAKAIYFPPGTYKITGSCLTLASAKRLYGDGTYTSIIDATGCTNSALTVNTGLTGVTLQSFAITRSGGATSGQDGIHFNNLTEQAYLQNLRVDGNWINFRFGITSYSLATDLLSNNAYSHGIYISNTDGSGGLQWYLTNVLSQQSNGDDIKVEAVTSSASVGTFSNVKTYANKGKGARFIGTSSFALQAIRWFGGFVGQDCDDEIYLDTYASSTHTIDGVFVEIAGTSACGVNLGTSATNVGHGIALTANNSAVVLSDNNIIGNSYSGISSAATRVQIVGNNLRINGAAAVGGELAGIAITAGNATITGNSSKAQAFGVTTGVDTIVVSGNDLSENTTAPLLASVSLINSVVVGNYPATTAVNFNRYATGHGDSAYSITQYDSFIYTNAAFTASRTWTLPAANAVAANKSITVSDMQGTVTGSNTLVVARAGSDTINGATSVTLSTAYDQVILVSDGVSKWTYKPAISSTSPGGSNTQVQFNNSSAFGGSANLTWVSPKLTIGVAGSTVGAIGFTNATSGSVSLHATTGALGTADAALPAGTYNLVGDSLTQTLTGKTLSGNTATNLISGSGTLTLNTSGTVTLPNATDTLVGKATTDTLTNKTFDTGGTGNSFSINGVAATTNTGTGSVVRSDSPVFTTKITDPLIIGGTATSSTLSLQSTSGVGATDAIKFLVGNNGATEAARFQTTGQLTVGSTAAPQANMIASFKGAGGGIMTIGQDPGLTGYAGLWTTSGTPSGTNYNFIADSSGSDPVLYFNAPGATGQLVFQTNAVSILQMDSAKHVRVMTSAPALTSCGTTPAISGSDIAGTVTMGTGAPTGCVITFNVAYAAAPYCVVTWQTNLASMQYTISTTAITLVQTGTSSNKVNYHCMASAAG